MGSLDRSKRMVGELRGLWMNAWMNVNAWRVAPVYNGGRLLDT